MLNPLAEELINRLRTDDHTRTHFHISSWAGRQTCGTVGCIAGTALAMAGELEQMKAVSLTHLTALTIGMDYSFTKEGAKVLGLGDMVATHLFLPRYYFGVLERENPFSELKGNEKPSDDWVADIRKWAEQFKGILGEPGRSLMSNEGPLQKYYTPDVCANALEAVTRDEMPYVDWKKAFQKEGMFEDA